MLAYPKDVSPTISLQANVLYLICYGEQSGPLRVVAATTKHLRLVSPAMRVS